MRLETIDLKGIQSEANGSSREEISLPEKSKCLIQGVEVYLSELTLGATSVTLIVSTLPSTLGDTVKGNHLVAMKRQFAAGILEKENPILAWAGNEVIDGQKLYFDLFTTGETNPLRYLIRVKVLK